VSLSGSFKSPFTPGPRRVAFSRVPSTPNYAVPTQAYVTIRRGTQRGMRGGRKKLNLFNFFAYFRRTHWTQKVGLRHFYASLRNTIYATLRYSTPDLRNNTLHYVIVTHDPLRLLSAFLPVHVLLSSILVLPHD